MSIMQCLNNTVYPLLNPGNKYKTRGRQRARFLEKIQRKVLNILVCISSLWIFFRKSHSVIIRPDKSCSFLKPVFTCGKIDVLIGKHKSSSHANGSTLNGSTISAYRLENDLKRIFPCFWCTEHQLQIQFFIW